MNRYHHSKRGSVVSTVYEARRRVARKRACGCMGAYTSFGIGMSVGFVGQSQQGSWCTASGWLFLYRLILLRNSFCGFSPSVRDQQPQEEHEPHHSYEPVHSNYHVSHAHIDRTTNETALKARGTYRGCKLCTPSRSAMAPVRKGMNADPACPMPAIQPMHPVSSHGGRIRPEWFMTIG